MNLPKSQRPMLAIAVLAIAAGGAGVSFFILWSEYLLFAVAASAVLLTGAALLPSRNVYLHGIAIGVCMGALAGGALGVVRYLAPEGSTIF